MSFKDGVGLRLVKFFQFVLKKNGLAYQRYALWLAYLTWRYQLSSQRTVTSAVVNGQSYKKKPQLMT